MVLIGYLSLLAMVVNSKQSNSSLIGDDCHILLSSATLVRQPASYKARTYVSK